MCSRVEMLNSAEEIKNLNNARGLRSILPLRPVASFVRSVSMNTKDAMERLCGHLYSPNALPMVNKEVSKTARSVFHGEELAEKRQKSKRGGPASRIGSTSFRGWALHVAAAMGFRREWCKYRGH